MSTGRGPDRERGAGTALVLALAAVVVVLVLAVAALGAAQRARGAAQAAADLGALAAASALRYGEDACTTASAAVGRNGAELATCAVEPGGVVRVSATQPAVGPPGWAVAPLGEATAAARAGPASVRTG
ncbi:Rv3654c family TadE-like protein [Isoptericola variabilis]|uniref:Helicase/secretion neighborhood TadE-like protein n=1 Tax=Isoptericola variabilis (strain 225) TaxID=743718 RepID=F6FTJ5_ISOV2|nr:Rv3654c family TadE-like protein [Isoptericola variabilis]AEG43188.1 helicase/secretion neighborhood TadE-like protein [Isoptericola variabilis 225]TWH35121.1 secretion/DNA translocation related TadE-like protein [Isoptericola variabilis J7]